MIFALRQTGWSLTADRSLFGPHVAWAGTVLDQMQCDRSCCTVLTTRRPSPRAPLPSAMTNL